MQLFSIICYLFTLYFVGKVAFETAKDLKETPKRPSLVYAKKFIKKFGENFIYHLP